MSHDRFRYGVRRSHTKQATALRQTVWIAVVVAGGAALLVMLLLYGLGFLLSPRRARRAFREHRILAGQISYRRDVENLYVSTPRTTSTLPWALFHAWLDGPEVPEKKRLGWLASLVDGRAGRVPAPRLRSGRSSHRPPPAPGR